MTILVAGLVLAAVTTVAVILIMQYNERQDRAAAAESCRYRVDAAVFDHRLYLTALSADSLIYGPPLDDAIEQLGRGSPEAAVLVIIHGEIPSYFGEGVEDRVYERAEALCNAVYDVA
jgi:hypothetical protein